MRKHRVAKKGIRVSFGITGRSIANPAIATKTAVASAVCGPTPTAAPARRDRSRTSVPMTSFINASLRLRPVATLLGAPRTSGRGSNVLNCVYPA